MLERASKLFQANKSAETDEVLKTLLASEGFSHMNAEQQHVSVNFATAAAFDVGDFKRALELTRRAAAMKSTNADDWNLQLSAAIRAGDKTEAASSLTALAERWPEKL